MSKIFEIKLTPFSTFFFGGEKSLANPDEQSYLVHSLRFPQQTTLLGMLRFELLRQNKLLENPYIGRKLNPDAAELIGKASFDSGDYGVIKDISPVFLSYSTSGKRDTHYFIEPLDARFQFQLDNGDGVKKLHGGFSSGLLLLVGYDAKEYYTSRVFGKNLDPVNLDEIFIPQLQTGVDKKRKNEAYFKQTFFRLKEGWCFKFYVLMDEKDCKGREYNIKSNSVWIGGERSMFLMDIIPMKEKLVEESAWKFPFNTNQIPNSGSTKIVLTSPANIPQSSFVYFEFSFSNIIPFRHLKSDVKSTEHYYNRSKQKNELGRSGFIELFDSGSVFYFLELDKMKRFITDINNESKYLQIGYNYYSII